MLRNTTIRCYCSVTVCVMTSPVTTYSIGSAVCQYVTHRNWHGGWSPSSNVYQVTNCTHVAQFVPVQMPETAVLHCVEQERSILFVCVSVPQRFMSAVRQIQLTFFHRTIRFNIIPNLRMILGQATFIHLPTTVLYTYLLALPSSTEVVLPTNIKQWVHLNSSVTPGGVETSVD